MDGDWDCFSNVSSHSSKVAESVKSLDDFYKYAKFEKYSKELNKKIVEFSNRLDIKSNINEFNAAVIINKTVREISLNKCKLGDKEIKVFAEAIKKNKNLTILDLKGNKIGCIGAKLIFEAIKEKQNFTKLNQWTQLKQLANS